MQFQSSRLKIERANKHIADIGTRIVTLPDSYVATVEIDPDGGNEVIKHDLTDKTAATDVALMIGDAAHNLKSALDHAWLEIIRRLVPSAVSKFAKFPVYPSSDELEIALKGRKIDTASPQLFTLIMSQIKPYGGGNDAIWPIHKLDIMDKHRLLVPTIDFASVSGIELENERGEIERGGTWGTMQQPPYFVPIQHGWHIKDKGKVSVHVIFGEGTPLRHMDVVGMLSLFSRTILKVIETMEKSSLRVSQNSLLTD